MSQILALYLDFEGAGSCLGFRILILIWIWSLVFGSPILQILALYIDFEDAKNNHVLKDLIRSFGGSSRFPPWVWYLNLDLNMVLGFCQIHVPNFGSLSWFWGCKEPPCPISHYLELWRELKVPDWGLASWSWFGKVKWSFKNSCSVFWLFILILKA